LNIGEHRLLPEAKRYLQMRITQTLGTKDKGEEALELHRSYRGKIETIAKCPMASYDDLATWYTPGAAAPARAIAVHPDLAYELTNKGNTVAVVSDGSRVLGLGNIGPEAAMPVMEGKALLFKHFGAVDAVPICLDAHEPDAIIATVRALAPTFGGINLEDIAAPKCFRILQALRTDLPIPVWHDDQQGTAAVVLAALLNALDSVGKRLTDARIALIGIGAANMAVYRILVAEGVSPKFIVACDSRGTLHAGRSDIEAHQQELAEKWRICLESNPDRIAGGISEAVRGADVCLAFSTPGPDVIPPSAIQGMAGKAIVFACANPVPEIWPSQALEAGARIVATGRSDFPNQVNNSLVFPGLFRGVFDVRASAISDGMARAAARDLAEYARRGSAGNESILPRTDDVTAAAVVAAAVGVKAQEEGLARLSRSHDALLAAARRSIQAAREVHNALLSQGLIRMQRATANP
jgi:malate dehydrogenase (oxaloacetate-decarboxylating)